MDRYKTGLTINGCLQLDLILFKFCSILTQHNSVKYERLIVSFVRLTGSIVIVSDITTMV